MTTPGWVCRTIRDVPEGNGWLGPREREALGALVVPRRRETWRLGRWTLKAALGAWLDSGGADAEILAAADGAPEAWAGGSRLDVEVSLSHRADIALAVVGDPGVALGCDVEVIEPRGGAFVREWLTPAEQARVVTGRSAGDAALYANLAWAGKEASAKVRREGLRLNVRAAEVACATGARGSWHGLTVTWPDCGADHGWWRTDGGYVLTVAAAARIGAPLALDSAATLSGHRR